MKSVFKALVTMLSQPSCLERALVIVALLAVLVILATIYPPAVAIIATTLATTAAMLIRHSWGRRPKGPDKKARC